MLSFYSSFYFTCYLFYLQSFLSVHSFPFLSFYLPYFLLFLDISSHFVIPYIFIYALTTSCPSIPHFSSSVTSVHSFTFIDFLIASFHLSIPFEFLFILMFLSALFGHTHLLLALTGRGWERPWCCSGLIMADNDDTLAPRLLFSCQ